MFPPPKLPSPGQLLLITDELAAPADFILHQSLGVHLKENKNSRCVVLSVSEGMDRWKTIAAKSNMNLANHLTSDLLVFVDVSATILPSPTCTDSKEPSMRSVYDVVWNALRKLQGGTNSMVILDDITSLGWIGFSPLDLVRFSRALRSLCFKSSASLIIRHHAVTPNEPDDLLRHLLQICSYHMDVRPLSSGRSGAVSGLIALHAGPCAGDSEFQSIPRTVAVQYRLTDMGAVFFDRGTGGGVL